MKSGRLKLHRLIPSAILIALILTACIKDKIAEITDNSYYTPNYSLPIGSHDFTMEKFIASYPAELILVPDTATIDDTVNLLYYDSLFFENPGHFDLLIDEPFDFSTYTSNLDYITSLMFRTNCKNGVPGKVSLQLYFLNASGTIIDSLYENSWLTVDPAKTSSDGIVTENHEQQNDSYLTDTMIARLPDVASILIFARLEIENFTTTQINYFSNQNFWVQLGIRVQLEIPLNEK
jgi:hypothetical protein